MFSKHVFILKRWTATSNILCRCHSRMESWNNITACLCLGPRSYRSKV